ncbi:hypothetical protein OUZ56_024909 [Daphnia magna]|uniref:Uncharacterized protein n=1 Tax=Daphnia magna TaxID=35525 RepID=A0ABQ9ZIC1_9CRUS|nr:hypothetical protein OUZ56_024909 [Daphnia magna]
MSLLAGRNNIVAAFSQQQQQQQQTVNGNQAAMARAGRATLLILQQLHERKRKGKKGLQKATERRTITGLSIWTEHKWGVTILLSALRYDDGGASAKEI